MSLEDADDLVRAYLDHVRDYAPVEATRLGLAGRDGELPDLAPEVLAGRARDLGRLKARVDAALGCTDPAATGTEREARDDLRLLAQELEYRWYLLEVRPRYELDPLAALETVGAGIHELLRRTDLDRAACCARLEAAAQRARRVPVLLEQAGSLLSSAPAPHLELALQRIDGVIALVRQELPRRAEQLDVDVSPARDAGEVAAEGLEAYGALLAELAEEPAGPWRLGPEEHGLVLHSAVGTTMRAHDIHARARAWRDHVRGELAELAASGWRARFGDVPMPSDPTARIRATLRAISSASVARDQLVDEARRAVAEARAFTLASELVDVPPDERLRVVEVPAHLSGIAVAFIAPPPPLDADAGCTFYVSPVPDTFDDDQARALLQEYTPAQLRSLAVHEGYPGHFVQLEHAAMHPRLARRVLTRSAFAEGWAVYIEREVASMGFASTDDTAVSEADFLFTQRRGELRIATNAMLDVGLHAGDLDDPGALELLTAGAFQEDAEAQGKLRRAKVSAGQMSSYFAGGEEIGDLRTEIERHEAPSFDLREFHQRLLSHGTPTVEVAAGALRESHATRRPFRAAV